MAAVLLITAGAFLLYNAFEIEPPRGYSVIDPNFFPIFISLGILGLGLTLLLRTTLVPDWDLAHTTTAEGRATHWATVFMLGGSLVIYAFALGPAGYIVATAVFVPAAARVMGSRNLLRDTIAGLVMAITIYFFFTEVLGIRLPAGILEPVL